MLDLSIGRSTLRALGLVAEQRTAAARVGVVFGPEHATLVRLQPATAGTGPSLQALQHVAVESSRRAEVVRRWLNNGVLRGARAVVVLGPGEYDLVQVSAPAVPDDELRDALRWQLRGTLPYSPEDAALDFVRVPQAADAPQRPTLLVLVAPRSTVALAVAPLVDCGVEIEAVDVPELAQRNLLQLAATGAGTTAWLGFETNACLLTVHAGSDLAFARRIPVTGLAHEVETEHQLAYLSERIGTQVQRSLDLVERQLGQPPASRILLSPHRHAQRIARDVAERTGLGVQVFDPVQALHVPEPDITLAGWGQDQMTGLGAALRAADPTPVDGTRPAWLQRLAALRRPPAPATAAA